MEQRFYHHILSPFHLDRVEAVQKSVSCGDLPPYRKFVDNLFKKHEKSSDELLHAAVGLAGEAGEVLDLAKKVWAYDKPIDSEKILEELGDLRFYYQALLNHFQLEDQDVIAFNMEKLAKRYHTGTFSKEQANARADKEPERKFMGAHRKE